MNNRKTLNEMRWPQRFGYGRAFTLLYGVAAPPGFWGFLISAHCLAVTFISVMEITMYRFNPVVPFKTSPIPIINPDRKTGTITQISADTFQSILLTFFGEGGDHE